MVRKFYSCKISIFFSKIIVRSFILLTLIILSPNFLHAEVITRINVEGNKSVDTQFILNALPIKIGTNVTNTDINEAVKRVFAQGLFSNVVISQNNGVLKVVVQEQNIIDQIVFEGNLLKKSSELQAVMGLRAGGFYSDYQALVDRSQILKLYAALGHKAAKVTIKPKSVKQGHVKVSVYVQDGKQERIHSIKFEGNKHFSSSRLYDILITKATGLISWITHNDVFTEERLEADKQLLTQFYQERGYADFYIVSSNVEFNPESNGYFIQFKLHEGEAYRLGNIRINNFINGLNNDAVLKQVELSTNDLYNLSAVQDSLVKLNNYLVNNGFPFASVSPSFERDYATQKINIFYNLTQGPALYIQKIDIEGNFKTKDSVIRREFSFNEGDAYNEAIVSQVRQRLLGLGYFSQIDIDVVPTQTRDRVNLVVHVKEQPTGQMSLSGGYTQGGDVPGFSLQGSIAQSNLFGLGDTASIVLGLGQSQSRTYSLSYSHPYLFGFPVTGSVSVYGSIYKTDYIQTNNAVSSSLSFPVSKNMFGSVSYNFSVEKYTNPSSAKRVPVLPSWYKSSISYSLTRSTIDNYVTPRLGSYIALQQEFAGLGGDAKFFKTTLRGNYFYPIVPRYDITAMLSGGAGYVGETSNQKLKIFDKFKNTVSMIRGFEYNGIGPTQINDGYAVHLGGNAYMNGTTEVDFAIPFLSKSIGLRGAVFMDAASLTDTTKENSIKKFIDNTRVSAGVGLIWNSPFGPLRIDYAQALRKKENDIVQPISFGISSQFQ